MNLVVFGATGDTGRKLVEQALGAGHEVTAIARKPQASMSSHERLDVLRGDVMDLDSVQSAMGGKDAAVSALGVGYSRKPTTVYSMGVCNILQAMKSTGVERFVGISAGGFVADPNDRPCSGMLSSPSSRAFSSIPTRTWSSWRRR